MQDPAIPPVVLLIGGNDPSGGAGLSADIQTVTALGAHPAPVVAALTAQDTLDVSQMLTLEPAFVVAQARQILADMPVAAIKLGLLASADVGNALADLLGEYRGLPLVVDPVLAAGGGKQLAESALLEVYRQRIFPLATLITPNATESYRLAPSTQDLQACATALLATGAAHVLITGADAADTEVHNVLYGSDGSREDFVWIKLPGTYHGSGCTLASAIAALLARGEPLRMAVHTAQQYTWDSLNEGWQLGSGQLIPNRQRRR
jgi:hydroxymethylpyrimidine/phosphomethylpyrimidine kinase